MTGDRRSVFLTEADSQAETGAKLAGALRFVQETGGQVIIWRSGVPVAIRGPPRVTAGVRQPGAVRISLLDQEEDIELGPG